MKYTQFGEIIKTMEVSNYDYKKEFKYTKPKESYTMSEHIERMVYAQLSNQRPWKPIEDNRSKINEIFEHFDAAKLKEANPEDLESEIRKIHCGNRQIHNQMFFLKDNIETLERIEKEHGSIDNYFRNTERYVLVRSLSAGKYKLKQMGVSLVCEYLKNTGIDLIKPDVHVLRILGRLGLTRHSPAWKKEAFDVCNKIAAEYKMREAEVDSVLWQFGADGYFEMCATIPKCEKCLVKDCNEKNEINIFAAGVRYFG